MANPIPNADTTAIVTAAGGLQQVYASESGGGASEVEVTNFPATQPVSGEVEVTNFPATQPVSGTVTVTGLAAAGSTQQGAITDPAYTDATGAASGTMIALLKGIYVQLAEINAKTPDPA